MDIDKLDSTLRRAWQSLKEIKRNIDDSLMAASLAQSGHPDLAAEIMTEGKKEEEEENKK